MPYDGYLDTDEDEDEVDEPESSENTGSEEENTDSASDNEEPNPGDELMWFGSRTGKKFDELEDWHLARFKDLYDRKEAWKEAKQSRIDPGKIPMWFGKYHGTLFEKLEDWYVNCLLNNWELDPNNCGQNTQRFKKLSDRYDSWLAAKHARKKSPGSIRIWFGEDKGREFRTIYRSQPRKWRWLINNHRRWAPRLLAIAKDYEEYLRTHRRKQPASRRKPTIVNPVGEKLSRKDDFPPSDTGSYDSDDGFVVRDEDNEGEDFSGDQGTDGDDDGDDDEDNTDAYRNREVVLIHPRSQPHNYQDTESDEDLPELSEIFERPANSPAPLSVRRSTKTVLVIRSGDESEEIISPSKRHTPRRATRAAGAVVDIESGEESEEIASPVKRNTPRRAARVVVEIESGGESEESEEIISPIKRRTAKRATRARSILSFVEPGSEEEPNIYNNNNPPTNNALENLAPPSATIKSANGGTQKLDDNTDDSDPNVPIPSSTRRRRSNTSPQKNTGSANHNSDRDSDRVLTQRTPKKMRGKRMRGMGSSSDSDTILTTLVRKKARMANLTRN